MPDREDLRIDLALLSHPRFALLAHSCRWACLLVLGSSLTPTSGAQAPHPSSRPPASAPPQERSLPVWRLEGSRPDSGFGWRFDGGGDVNGDGYDDLVIGEPEFEPEPRLWTGRVQIFHGSPDGFGQLPDQVIAGDAWDAGFGTCVALLGDVNGDGFADVGISSSSTRGGPFVHGRISVFHGQADGLDVQTPWSFSGDENLKDVWYVAAAGDVNGDGFGDVVVGARNPAGAPPQAGEILVFHGSASGLAPAPAWTRRGTQAEEYYGSSVCGAGDLNHDGFGDLIVGTPHHNCREENDGLVEVFLGGPKGLAPAPAWVSTHTPGPTPRRPAAGRYQLFGGSVDGAGDVNGDGISDWIAAGAYISNEEDNEGAVFAWHGSRDGQRADWDWTAQSGQPQALFGHAIAGVGDVNGDGFDDVLIAAIHLDHGELNEGLVALYHGSAKGLSRWPAWTAEGDEPQAAFGAHVAALGDVNRDGLADFAVGSSRHQKAGHLVGEIRVFFGQRGGLHYSSGWNRQPTLLQRVSHAGSITATRAGWRLAIGVTLAAALTGVIALWMLRSYRRAQAQIARLRRRVEDLASAAASDAPEDSVPWQRFASELRRSLDPASEEAQSFSSLVSGTVAWAVGFASTRGFALAVDVSKPENCQAMVEAPMANALTAFVRVTLANVAEHSQARQASLRIVHAESHVLIEVRDDGCGFDPAILDEPTRVAQGRLGLGAIRARVHSLKGQFELESQPARGTTVRARLPWSRPSVSQRFLKHRRTPA